MRINLHTIPTGHIVTDVQRCVDSRGNVEVNFTTVPPIRPGKKSSGVSNRFMNLGAALALCQAVSHFYLVHFGQVAPNMFWDGLTLSIIPLALIVLLRGDA